MRHDIDAPVSRRTVLGGTAVALTGSAALALWPDDTEAAISFSGLTIPDRNVTLAPDERVEGVALATHGELEYQSSHALDARAVFLEVDVNGVGFEELARTETQDPPQEVASDTWDLTANLLDHSGLSTGMLDVSEGQTTTTTLGVRAVLHLMRGGDVVGVADSQTTADLQITKDELTISAVLGGEGGMTPAIGTETPTA